MLLSQISTGDLVKTAVTESIGDGFFGVEMDDKQSGTLSLGKTRAFVATIGTVAIDENRSSSILSSV